jgi:hypothetical protein
LRLPSQEWAARHEWALGFIVAAVALVGGFVAVSLALRAAVLEVQSRLRRRPMGSLDTQLLSSQPGGKAWLEAQQAAAAVAHDGESLSGLGAAGACALFVVPSALNAGWMGLASCLGIMQVRTGCWGPLLQL